MLENNFYQTTKNIEKAAAYYTDDAHCKRLSELFVFPEGEEVCILEPSAGDGRAVKTVTRKCKNRRIFAVELNNEVADTLKNDEEMCEVLNCDFLTTKISRNSFSFCFSNPPYINDEGRMEIEFLKKITNYMMDGGIIVYIIPYIVASSKQFLRAYFSKFEPICEFRFDDSEYSKYRQIVFIGRRSQKAAYEESVIIKYAERKKEDYNTIPERIDEKIEVLPSMEANISVFTTKVFDAQKGYECLVEKNPQKSNLKKIGVKPYENDDVPVPPVMPNQNTLYLLSTLGCGSGITGSVEGKDIHLQRGCAKIVERVFDDVNDDGSVDRVKQVSTQVSVTILENDGTFTVLE